LAVSAVVFVGTTAAVRIGGRPLLEYIRRQYRKFDDVLRQEMLSSTNPTAAMIFTWLIILLIALLGYVATSSVWGAVLFFAGGLFLPNLILKIMKRRHVRKLEEQLVGAVQTLASGVRAGLNLVQAMQMVARDGPEPICDEFAHLLREYEYGVPLDEAMNNAAERIDSGDFRLLFSALHTHRERGGDLGETLDRIAESVREIQRLEKRIEALTAQGRATARWLGAMPALVLGLLALLVDPAGVRAMFTTDMGKLIIAIILALNIAGFLWIRKIVAVDI
jgi:tight adherence protein B